jgi:hypothetical protein
MLYLVFYIIEIFTVLPELSLLGRKFHSNPKYILNENCLICAFPETDNPAKGSTSPSLETSDDRKTFSPHVSLIKLSRSGLLLFAFHDNEFNENVVDVLSDIFLSLRSGKLKSPRSVSIIIFTLTYKEDC